MKEKGKAVEFFSKDFSKFNLSSDTGTSCRKHPKSSSVGVCPVCLKERLLKLVCSECGEKRHSSCSCSSMEVGRMSFLLENDTNESQPSNTLARIKSRREEKPKQVEGLRRSSSSSCKEVNEHNGFWALERLFRRRRDTKIEKDNVRFDVKSEFWFSESDSVDVFSRSRSLCSFRGDDSAKISDATNGIFLGSGKRLLCTESDSDTLPKQAATGTTQPLEEELDKATKRTALPSTENDLSIMDESELFDLSFDFPVDRKPETSTSDHGFNVPDSACRRSSKNERRQKRESGSSRVWRWVFRYRRLNKEARCLHGS